MMDSAAIRSFATAKGYVQSAFVMMTANARFSVPDDTTFMLSFHMLVGFAVELYLKAILYRSGRSEAEVRKAGHDLVALLSQAKKVGLVLPEAGLLVQELSEQHRSYEYRYMQPDSKYKIIDLSIAFHVLDALNYYVDETVGASAARGLSPRRGGWRLPVTFGWRHP